MRPDRQVRDLLEINGVSCVVHMDTDGFLLNYLGRVDMADDAEAYVCRAALLIGGAKAMEGFFQAGDLVQCTIDYRKHRFILFDMGDDSVLLVICTRSANQAAIRLMANSLKTS